MKKQLKKLTKIGKIIAVKVNCPLKKSPQVFLINELTEYLKVNNQEDPLNLESLSIQMGRNS